MSIGAVQSFQRACRALLLHSKILEVLISPSCTHAHSHGPDAGWKYLPGAVDIFRRVDPELKTASMDLFDYLWHLKICYGSLQRSTRDQRSWR